MFVSALQVEFSSDVLQALVTLNIHVFLMVMSKKILKYHHFNIKFYLFFIFKLFIYIFN